MILKLGSPRKNIWCEVQSRIYDNDSTYPLDSTDYNVLKTLASNKQWLEMIPLEWLDIRKKLYEEPSLFVIDERDKINIDKDIHRTFSLFFREENINKKLLHDNNNMVIYAKALRSVLMAASREGGYCQGINFIAASLLLQETNETTAYILLSFLLKHRHIAILYNPRCSSLLEYMNCFEKRLRKHNKSVYLHFKAVDFGPICYALEWFTTCFVVTCPGELSCCVLDLLLGGVDDALIRVGLALLDHLEPHILVLDQENLQMQFKTLTANADPSEVMYRALLIPFRVDCRRNLLQFMAQNIDAINSAAEGSDRLIRHTCRPLVHNRDNRPSESSADNEEVDNQEGDSAASSSVEEALCCVADDEMMVSVPYVARGRSRRLRIIARVNSASQSQDAARHSRRDVARRIIGGVRRQGRVEVLLSDIYSAALLLQIAKEREAGKVDGELSDSGQNRASPPLSKENARIKRGINAKVVADRSGGVKALRRKLRNFFSPGRPTTVHNSDSPKPTARNTDSSATTQVLFRGQSSASSLIDERVDSVDQPVHLAPRSASKKSSVKWLGKLARGSLWLVTMGRSRKHKSPGCSSAPVTKSQGLGALTLHEGGEWQAVDRAEWCVDEYYCAMQAGYEGERDEDDSNVSVKQCHRSAVGPPSNNVQYGGAPGTNLLGKVHDNWFSGPGVNDSECLLGSSGPGVSVPNLAVRKRRNKTRSLKNNLLLNHESISVDDYYK